MLLPLLRLARPRQWVKNAFVAAPLFFSPWAVNAANAPLPRARRVEPVEPAPPPAVVDIDPDRTMPT